MRITAESNNIITELRLFRAIERRNFPQGLELLNKQLDFTQSLSPGNNLLLKSLINNTKYSFDNTVSIEDRDYFELFCNWGYFRIFSGDARSIWCPWHKRDIR